MNMIRNHTSAKKNYPPNPNRLRIAGNKFIFIGLGFAMLALYLFYRELMPYPYFTIILILGIVLSIIGLIILFRYAAKFSRPMTLVGVLIPIVSLLICISMFVICMKENVVKYTSVSNTSRGVVKTVKTVTTNANFATNSVLVTEEIVSTDANGVIVTTKVKTVNGAVIEEVTSTQRETNSKL